MKKLIFLLMAMLLPMLMNAQEATYKVNPDGSITFERIIPAENKNADILYGDIESFMANNYNNANNVIQAQNKEQHFLIGKGVFPEVNTWKDSTWGIKYIVNIPHTVRFDCKDNKIRVQYTVSNYDQESGNWVNFSKNHSSSTKAISTAYPILPAKKEGKLSKDEKRNGETFKNLEKLINSQFDIITQQINTNNSDW